jgi:hypothetical protein
LTPEAPGINRFSNSQKTRLKEKRWITNISSTEKSKLEEWFAGALGKL